MSVRSRTGVLGRGTPRVPAGAVMPQGTTEGQISQWDADTGLWIPVAAPSADAQTLIWNATAEEWQASRSKGPYAVSFSAISYGGAAAGQLHGLVIGDAGAAAGALPLTVMSSYELPSTGGRIVGFEVCQHLFTPGINVNWHLHINQGAAIAAFNVVLLAAANRVGIWPATPYVFGALATNSLNVSFDMAAPIAGNNRPSATVWLELL
jgi:hypothetical protein